jgi:hypothetical protein
MTKCPINTSYTFFNYVAAKSYYEPDDTKPYIDEGQEIFKAVYRPWFKSSAFSIWYHVDTQTNNLLCALYYSLSLECISCKFLSPDSPFDKSSSSKTHLVIDNPAKEPIIFSVRGSTNTDEIFYVNSDPQKFISRTCLSRTCLIIEETNND